MTYGSGRDPGSAAPQVGGALRHVRGCAALLAGGAVATALCAPVGAQEIAVEVPSGQPVTLFEILYEDTAQGRLARFRYLAPEIGTDAVPTFDAVQSDLAHLCANHVVPTLSETAQTADRVVVSLSDRRVPFGQADAEATQMFEAFRLENGLCIWEMF